MDAIRNEVGIDRITNLGGRSEEFTLMLGIKRLIHVEPYRHGNVERLSGVELKCGRDNSKWG